MFTNMIAGPDSMPPNPLPASICNFFLVLLIDLGMALNGIGGTAGSASSIKGNYLPFINLGVPVCSGHTTVISRVVYLLEGILFDGTLISLSQSQVPICLFSILLTICRFSMEKSDILNLLCFLTPFARFPSKPSGQLYQHSLHFDVLIGQQTSLLS